MPSPGPFVQRKDELECTILPSIKQHKSTTKMHKTKWETGRPSLTVMSQSRAERPGKFWGHEWDEPSTLESN